MKTLKMPHALNIDDILSLFLTSSSDINFDAKEVRSRCFAGKHPLGFSVFHTNGQSEAQIWLVAFDHVIHDITKPLLGRHDVAVGIYEHCGLAIEQKEPPPKHYEIYGFPVSADAVSAKNLSNRQFLVNNAKLTLYHN